MTKHDLHAVKRVIIFYELIFCSPQFCLHSKVSFEKEFCFSLANSNDCPKRIMQEAVEINKAGHILGVPL
jgi:hypothetical protein